MYLIKLFSFSKIKILQIIIFISVIIFSNILSKVKDIPVSLDEIAWVNDSRVFEERVSNNYQYFEWKKGQPVAGWTSVDFRLFDQPHLVKYIYGAILTNLNHYQWNNGDYENNNRLFLEQSLPNNLLLNTIQSKQILGDQTDQAVQTNRKVSTFFTLLFLFTLFLFLLNISSFIHSIFVTILLTSNQVFIQNLLVATADSISLFFVLASVILVYKLFWNINKLSSKKYFVLIYLLAISTALAASAKINGWFLIPLIAVFFSIKLIFSETNFLYKYKKVALERFILWIITFIGTYWYLQPELWQNGFEGLIRFFSQRVSQHQRFIVSFGSFNVFEFHDWILRLLFSSSLFTSALKNNIFILVGLSGLLLSVMKNYRRQTFRKIMLISLWIWLSVFLYARVGFDRYGLWLVILLTVILSYGWIEVLNRVINQFKKLSK